MLPGSFNFFAALATTFFFRVMTSEEILSYMAHNVYVMLLNFAFKIRAKYEVGVRSSELNQHQVLCYKVINTPGQV